jgi:hypothetical protein
MKRALTIEIAIDDDDAIFTVIDALGIAPSTPLARPTATDFV